MNDISSFAIDPFPVHTTDSFLHSSTRLCERTVWYKPFLDSRLPSEKICKHSGHHRTFAPFPGKSRATRCGNDDSESCVRRLVRTRLVSEMGRSYQSCNIRICSRSYRYTSRSSSYLRTRQTWRISLSTCWDFLSHSVPIAWTNNATVSICIFLLQCISLLPTFRISCRPIEIELGEK